jgi:hypothetical protein
MMKRAGTSTPMREWNLRVEKANRTGICYVNPLSLPTVTVAMMEHNSLARERTIKSIIKSMRYVNERN